MKLKLTLLLLFISFLSKAQNIDLYVGTYTSDESKGIYCLKYNEKTGELSNLQLAATAENPSFLAILPNKKALFAVSETDNYNATFSGYINAYTILPNGTLNFVNKVSSNGAHPCHIQLHNKGKMLAVSNYTGGTVSLHTIENGKINAAFQVINHAEKGKITHVHSAKFINNNLWVADLGLNTVTQYSKNTNDSIFTLKNNNFIKNNGGPRHFEISKNKKFIYVINELNSSITVFQKNKSDAYEFVQNISTLNANFKGKNSCADIHLSKNGKFIYGSNRGENTIVVFKVNKKNGVLTKIQSVDIQGDWPRNFTLAPKENFLLVANKKSQNISVFKRNKTTGILTFQYRKNVPTPVCLVFKK